MKRSRLVSGSIVLFLVGVASGYWLQYAMLPKAQGDSPRLTPQSEREQLFKDLAREAEVLEQHGRAIGLLTKLVKPSVVHIEAKKLNEFRSRYIDEAGSGVIVQIDKNSKRFFVLTNAHVIRGADEENIKVRLDDGRVLHPLRMWQDAPTDVAVMEIAGDELIAARVGNSSDVEIGQFVVAVGSPFGLNHSFTYGIISAKGRRDLELGGEAVKYQDFMQTDAAINPGNSGGPLVNLRGEVIGINTAIASNSGGNEGIGFSIPVNMVTRIAEQLIANGKVMRAFLGVELDPRFGPTAAARLGLPRPRGARITGVRENTPAFDARLKTGDVVLEFDGITIEDDAHLINLVGLTQAGKEVPLVIWRNRDKLRLTIRVGDRRLLTHSQ